MPLVWEQAHGRASMHTGGVDGRGPGRAALAREKECIMLAGFQEDRAGMDTRVELARSGRWKKLAREEETLP